MNRPLRPAAVLAATAIAALTATEATAQTCLCGTAADEVMAARVGLEREWVVQVPFDSAAWRLERVVVGERFVVAQSGDGTVAAIVGTAAADDPAPGTVIWSRRTGRPGGLILPPGVGTELVALAHDLAVAGVDAEGRQWTRPIGGSPTTAALPSGDWVYAPVGTGGVLQLPANPFRGPPASGEADPQPDEDDRRPASEPPRRIDAEGRFAFPPVAYDGGILWCTTSGRLKGLVPKGEAAEDFEELVGFDLRSPASGPPVVRGSDVYVATLAGDLVRLREARTVGGKRTLSAVAREIPAAASDDPPTVLPAWHAFLDAQPEDSPLVGDGVVVVSLGPAGLAGFAADTGDPIWTSARTGRLLAITGGRFWVRDATGRLASFDLATGAPLERLCLGCFTLPVTSTVGNRLVLASPGGLVVSLADPRVPRPALPVASPGPAAQPAPDAESEPDGDAEPAADEAA